MHKLIIVLTCSGKSVPIRIDGKKVLENIQVVVGTISSLHSTMV